MTRPRIGSVLLRLVETGLLRPPAMAAFAAAAATGGVNLASVPDFAARWRGNAVALVDDGAPVTFSGLSAEIRRMSAALRDAHGVRPGDVVGVFARNGGGLVRGVFAASRLGARVTLLNPEMSAQQLHALIDAHSIRLVIVDAHTLELANGCACPVIDAAALLSSAPPTFRRLARINGGELVVLTGGTTGPPKAARRRPSVRNFALLFIHLVTALGLDRHPSAYIAVPLFHGYGMAALLVAMSLGRTVYLTPRFRAEDACALIARERLEVVAVVPSMLQRMLALDGADLSPLKRVISGGAALPPALAMQTRERLGEVLFNLYGSSEAGVSVFATPTDLAAAPDTIGREIWGVRVTLRGDDDHEVPTGQLGRLCVQSHAAVARDAWIETGDLGLRDREGRLYVRGRVDDMIVSGGENVSPWELETVLLTHPRIREAAVVGVPDPDFGQRLVAFVVGDPETSADAISDWLEDRVARYQRPRAIHITEALPLTAVGKVDKRALAARV